MKPSGWIGKSYLRLRPRLPSLRVAPVTPFPLFPRIFLRLAVWGQVKAGPAGLASLPGQDRYRREGALSLVELVIIPRSIINDNPQEQQNQPPPPPPPPPQNEDSTKEQNEEEYEEIPEEFIFDAVGGLVDKMLLFFTQQAQRRNGKAGRAKNVIFSEDRGRYIKPMLPEAVRVGLNAEKSGDDEILEVAGKIYKAGMSLLVIDTENKFVSTGFAKEIARIAQGKYYYLPNASDAVISATTKKALAVLKIS
ncbi:hypothetical protein Syun_019466 [Stephania yunnanensis]|uniref:Uncharacterized protein n=1 Tax=Stephania yunnanensis TaxID=152371 RepID=A0AAP0IUA9_9MAGN